MQQGIDPKAANLAAPSQTDSKNETSPLPTSSGPVTPDNTQTKAADSKIDFDEKLEAQLNAGVMKFGKTVTKIFSKNRSDAHGGQSAFEGNAIIFRPGLFMLCGQTKYDRRTYQKKRINGDLEFRMLNGDQPGSEVRTEFVRVTQTIDLMRKTLRDRAIGGGRRGYLYHEMVIGDLETSVTALIDITKRAYAVVAKYPNRFRYRDEEVYTTELAQQEEEECIIALQEFLRETVPLIKAYPGSKQLLLRADLPFENFPFPNPDDYATHLKTPSATEIPKQESNTRPAPAAQPRINMNDEDAVKSALFDLITNESYIYLMILDHLTDNVKYKEVIAYREEKFADLSKLDLIAVTAQDREQRAYIYQNVFFDVQQFTSSLPLEQARKLLINLIRDPQKVQNAYRQIRDANLAKVTAWEEQVEAGLKQIEQQRAQPAKQESFWQRSLQRAKNFREFLHEHTLAGTGNKLLPVAVKAVGNYSVELVKHAAGGLAFIVTLGSTRLADKSYDATGRLLTQAGKSGKGLIKKIVYRGALLYFRGPRQLELANSSREAADKFLTQETLLPLLKPVGFGLGLVANYFLGMYITLQMVMAKSLIKKTQPQMSWQIDNKTAMATKVSNTHELPFRPINVYRFGKFFIAVCDVVISGSYHPLLIVAGGFGGSLLLPEMFPLREGTRVEREQHDFDMAVLGDAIGHYASDRFLSTTAKIAARNEFVDAFRESQGRNSSPEVPSDFELFFDFHKNPVRFSWEDSANCPFVDCNVPSDLEAVVKFEAHCNNVANLKLF